MSPLKGTGVALVTPFKADSSVDYDALDKLIDHLILGGVDYLVSLGTTGETPVLSKQEKIDIINFTCDKASDKLPVVVGIGGNDTATILSDFDTLPLGRAAYILSASPYYNKPSQEGIFQHYKTLAAHAPLPIILYNVPGRTGRNMEASTTLRIANEVENVIGIKEASGNMVQCMELLRERPAGFLVLSGDDDLVMPQIACGMDGVISVAANAFPRLFSDMIRYCLHMDFVQAKILNDKLYHAYRLMFAENNPAGVKAFLAEMGIIQDVLRLPLVPLSEQYRQQVTEVISKINGKA